MSDYLIKKKVECDTCKGKGSVNGTKCICRGKGYIYIEVDADEWLREALERVGEEKVVE